MISFPTAARAVDEDGDEFATKRVLAVALDSSALEVKTTLEDKLRPYAEGLRALLPEGQTAFARAAETLAETMPGLATILRNAKITMAIFIDKFPAILTRQNRLISAA